MLGFWVLNHKNEGEDFTTYENGLLEEELITWRQKENLVGFIFGLQPLFLRRKELWN
jgi:hypothetical protein